ncbi:hypothetical protein RGQ21_15300 [Kitasatospora aureofaciens]|nr:hypothetical protein RGQ21_15300 [Kitasatospora aureofaciens]
MTERQERGKCSCTVECREGPANQGGHRVRRPGEGCEASRARQAAGGETVKEEAYEALMGHGRCLGWAGMLLAAVSVALSLLQPTSRSNARHEGEFKVGLSERVRTGAWSPTWPRCCPACG